MNLITLTTDFGPADWFVGTMKGVILGINPRARMVDLTHGIPPGDIRSAAFALMAACRHFPRGTVHVAVVDPGVGSERAAIVVQTADYFFVGPDNGLLSFALAAERIKTVHRLENRRFFRRDVSRTFHGRDVFAPVAAHLTKGADCRKMGRRAEEMVHLSWPQPAWHGSSIIGEIVYVDHFGNAITNITEGLLDELQGERMWRRQAVKRGKGADSPPPGLRISMPGGRTAPVETCYAGVHAGKPVAVAGSTGFLEIGIHGGHAARRFRLKIGSPVRLG